MPEIQRWNVIKFNIRRTDGGNGRWVGNVEEVEAKEIKQSKNFRQKLNAKCFISDKNFFSQTSERASEKHWKGEREREFWFALQRYYKVR